MPKFAIPLETLRKQRYVDGAIEDGIKLNYSYRQEMEYLLELCGYKAIGVYNDYYYSAAVDNFIWVLSK